MTMIKLPFIDRFRDRHGVERFYFRRRRGDRRIPLSGVPGSAQFRDDYEHALAVGGGKAAGPGTRKRGAPGTFDALLERISGRCCRR
jgi:hypothetical protein